jgi:hypothetical protein
VAGPYRQVQVVVQPRECLVLLWGQRPLLCINRCGLVCGSAVCVQRLSECSPHTAYQHWQYGNTCAYGKLTSWLAGCPSTHVVMVACVEGARH